MLHISPLDSRVVLCVKDVVGGVLPPCVAGLQAQVFDLADPVWGFQELDGESLVGVPSDMAVHYKRVVSNGPIKM